MKKKIYRPAADYLVDKMKLPADVMLGDTKFTITGDSLVFIENYKGLLEYSSEKILVLTKQFQICFEGKNLKIEYYTNEDMKISGKLMRIQYL